MQPYPSEIEQAMKKYYATLSEKDRRRYAAVEALKLGHGGQSYLAELLGCSEKTVSRGLDELDELPERPAYEPLLRKPGGGRNRYDEAHPDLDRQFLEVLKEHTAGDPLDERVVWTDLTPQEIATLLAKHHQVRVSKSVVRKLLKKHQYRRRQAQKKQTLKSVAHRDEQFVKIAELKAEFQAAGNPIISFDTKKCVMAGAAMTLAITSSRKTCKSWPMSLGLKSELLTIRLTAPSTTRSSIVCFRMSRAPVKA